MKKKNKFPFRMYLHHWKGILFCSILLFALQSFYFWKKQQKLKVEWEEASSWEALQQQWDAAVLEKKETKYQQYPFNPNFITEYKGYTLGMSLQEIKRLHAFRAQNKYVNSAKEFQQVTQVSDSLLKEISPYFKFPDWVNQPKKAFAYQKFEKKTIVKKDINLATKEDFMAVYGIGDALSDRIMKFRDKLGAFVSLNQLHDVWGLTDEVIENLEKRFYINDQTQIINKIKINEINIKDLANFPYFNFYQAKEIIKLRSQQGTLKSGDLTKIKEISEEKLKTIELYLEF
ncbi:MAG: helix-hairpin-helix domain-containing protein [Flavobacterium sp.]